jgi:hypothetical protein
MADENQDDVVNPAGMPEIHPPKNGPANDPDSPDPGLFVPGRPGAPAEMERSDADHAADGEG